MLTGCVDSISLLLSPSPLTHLLYFPLLLMSENIGRKLMEGGV